MQKIFKKIVLASAVLGVVGTLASCSGSKDDPNTLEIYITNAGYRYEWCEALRDRFLEQDWVQEKYPNLKVTVYQNDSQTYADTLMKAGKSSNRFDLLISMNLIGFSGTEDVLDLTDLVYNTKIPGTDTLYKDVVFGSYLESFQHLEKGDYGAEPRYYVAPWAGGMNGIVYNESFFEELDYKVPNTTDEFIAICKDFHDRTYKGEKNTTQYVFIQGKDESYFDNIFDVFWGQYQSIQGYYDYFNGIHDGALSRKIFEQKGRLKSLEVMYDLVGNNNNYVSPKTSYTIFMESQRVFLKGEALFNVNGDWFVSEMKNIKQDMADRDGINYSFKMMRTPIVSDVIELCDTIEDDAELSALITAIDNEDTALMGQGYEVDQEDYDKIKEARGVVSSLGSNHHMIVPSYALCKDAAVDFIRFMATNTAQDEYIKTTNGASLPFTYDLEENNPELYASIDPLHKERIAYLNSDFLKPYTLPSRFTFPLLRYGGVDAFYLGNGYDFFQKMRMDNKLPSTYYNETIEYYTQARFDDACRRAGLI